jgi:hypothetical protein
MRHALILSGAGRYADPWHPYADTSRCLASIIETVGLRCEISGDVDARMAELGSAAPDLLVLNVGDPALNFPDAPAREAEERGRAGLLGYLAAGGPLLGVHATVTSFRGIPEWRAILGGQWIRGHSFHPDYGPVDVAIDREASSFAANLPDFTVDDERYSHLALESDNLVLAAHRAGPVTVPLAWARTAGRGGARVVYDALGHDTAAYDSVGHRALLARCVAWLTEPSRLDTV